MWTMILTLPMAYLIGACLDALPEKQRKIPSGTGWFFILPLLMSAVNPIVKYSSGTSMTLINELMFVIGALLCYYVNRAIAFVGLVASYQTYGRDRLFRVPGINVVMAWALAVLEPVWMATLFGLAFFTGYPGKLNVPGMAEIMLFVTLTLAVGIGFSYVFLMAMYSERRRILESGKMAAKPGAVKTGSISAKPAPFTKPPSGGTETASFKGLPPFSGRGASPVSGRSAAPDAGKSPPPPKPLATGGAGRVKDPENPPQDPK